MCLYPQKMVNKKYTATAKNGGCVPTMKDERTAYVQIPCGKCIECRQQKARNWMVRLGEEIPNTQYNYFVTLTFSPEQLGKLRKKTNLSECNALFGIALRRSLERWRKDQKKSIKHWFITELGHEGTERIHAHGILFSDKPLEWQVIEPGKDGNMCKWKYWNYGKVYVGTYVSMRTVNYLMKYVTKIDTDHKHFNGYIFCSPGLGKTWLERMQQYYKYVPGESLDYFRLPNGSKVKLPTYYKNHCYNEEEREKIWCDFMDKEKTTIAGNVYRDKQSAHAYGNITAKAQEVNKRLGYGDDSQEWRKMPYNITPAMLRKGQLPGATREQQLRWQNIQEIDKKLKKLRKNLEESK